MSKSADGTPAMVARREWAEANSNLRSPGALITALESTNKAMAKKGINLDEAKITATNARTGMKVYLFALDFAKAAGIDLKGGKALPNPRIPN